MKIRGDLYFDSLIHPFKHGIEILSATHWITVSASGFRISVASIVGVAGLLLAFRDAKFRNFRNITSSFNGDDSRDKLWLVPGLQNLGNNCFLNVILQALASCSCFQGFLRKIVEEFEASSEDGRVGSMPLVVALDSLLEELSTVRHVNAVLSPRKVMLAMVQYLPNFNLSCQQDAEEAFFHILSSLREELSEFYALNRRSLADVTALSSCRILTPKAGVVHSEQERWSQNFLGPFDGILGSILTCQSCSFQISMDFQFFHSLYLSPVLRVGGSIMPGCSMVDCLMQFFAAEQLESYSCSHCWHTAAIKYLSLIDRNEADIEKLRCCSEQDSCDCKNISSVGALPWSNNFSRTFKQLHVSRAPKILCIHLQRASVNVFGEVVKLQGHISFPLTLNLSRFLKSDFEIMDSQRNLLNSRRIEPYQQPLHYNNYLKVQLDSNMSNNVYGQTAKSAFVDEVVDEGFTQTPYEALGDKNTQAVQKEPRSVDTRYCSNIMPCSTTRHPNGKLDGTRSLAHVGRNNYRLVSVVEHFGTSGSGHYTVYRRVAAKFNDGDCDGTSVSSPVHWFCVSDSQVSNVSEKDVLAAAASMLFYEKVSES